MGQVSGQASAIAQQLEQLQIVQQVALLEELFRLPQSQPRQDRAISASQSIASANAIAAITIATPAVASKGGWCGNIADRGFRQADVRHCQGGASTHRGYEA